MDPVGEESMEWIIDGAKLLGAFLLTSILGRWFADRLQNRAWEHQRRVKLRDEERSQAWAVFDDISRLLDTRLYRNRQIVYAFRSGDNARVEGAFSDYRKILYEWNENINRNYARVEVYFGVEKRKYLEEKISKDLIFIGTLLERFLKNAPDARPLGEVWEKIDYVNGLVYDFDKSLLCLIEQGMVGQFRTQ